jgi:RNA polymerase sigma-70 factor, ECF subfamily
MTKASPTSPPPASDSQIQFTRLFIANQQAFSGFLVSLVHDREVVDDLLQELAERLWRKYPEYDPERPFVAWGLQFARFLGLEWRRRQERLPLALDEETLRALAERSKERIAADESDRSLLRRCMERLTELQRQVLHSRYFEEVPVAELARRRERSEVAIYQVLRRVHSSLFECMRTGRAGEAGRSES